ncbi:MAG: DUF718 domain-containing protein [Alphaproteobacteria bacterium]|nr:DUF718 domain-containing protein [Alphaproteobacteria bacterium]
MKAYNVVRFRVKAGQDAKFIDMHKNFPREPGMEDVALIKTGERSYCLIGKWSNFEAIAAARPNMIRILDGFRDLLEDLGGGLGVTDPVSGPVVAEI